MQDLRAELAATLDEAEWTWLCPHAKRDSLIVVATGLDLVDVGVAIANDNVPSVQRWIGEQLIYKPSDIQKEAWNSNPTQRFNALIVQPYVLIQELPAA
ncbi:DUF2288 domain-containing protein [Microseira sp. BLCC-F43]|jgi:hypothetical protein|uniref:DUF2288 domain-containing protein n=1 Tax=Microseira sp. BLCC-F43 TaxID=3153602 RepID=UPI0035B6B295